ncbi:hypothetical protein ACIBQ1_51675 [Nonomuraea sp. NPDC050153]|uniref:hypothetical protein n=1 Tax=Nonomuraea sp. NPDC050153 TaxID=3364359 RepID=UPI00379219FC
MVEFRIPAADLHLGDEVEMYEKDPINPYFRNPGSPGIYWQVAELFDKGLQEYLDEKDLPIRHETIGAVLVRKLTQEDLGLHDTAWQAMLIKMGLSLDAKHITLTVRSSFIKHHVVRVRRPDSTPEADRLRQQLAAGE